MNKRLRTYFKPTHLSLFSGIGGLDLAAEWAGFKTVGQCEFADYPTKVLEKHWPDVPRWKDIRTLTKESFYGWTGMRTVDLISGGFPCQPFSTAGKRKGKDDDRYLWPEMLRVIKEIRPTWVVGENVAGIASMALDDILFELEAQQYETRAFMVPAAGVGAVHKRYRFAILAYSNSNRQQSLIKGENQSSPKWQNAILQQTWSKSGDIEPERLCPRTREYRNCWESEPRIRRVANGVPNQVERLRCLGNAVVPQQFYPIFRAIHEIITRDFDEGLEISDCSPRKHTEFISEESAYGTYAGL